MIDVNVSCGTWPFGMNPSCSAEHLNRRLAENGIARAVASSMDAVFSADLDRCNDALISALSPYKTLCPLLTVNPLLANFQTTIDRSAIHAVRILPSYHNYSILSEESAALAGLLSEKNMSLVIQVRIEDERSHNPVCLVPSVPVKDIIRFAKKFPDLQILCLCPYFAEVLELCQDAENIHCDISFAEIFNFINRLLRDVKPEKILFGSHTPFLYTEAAVMKLKYAESDEICIKRISSENAERFFRLRPFSKAEK